MKPARVPVARYAVALALTGCTATLGPTGEGENDDVRYGFETGPTMQPGENCRSCHGAVSSRYPLAPEWTVAGTVFRGPTSDEGAPGVTVHVKGADGEHFTLVTNAAGNFYTNRIIEAPYWVALEMDDVVVAMPVTPPSGGCNACHADPPVGDAPGRLYVPASGRYSSKAVCDGEHTITIDDQTFDCSPFRCVSNEVQGTHCAFE